MMLETIREYALERLAASGATEALRRRHVEYFLALAETAEPRFHGPDQRAWLDRIEVEHDNLRAVLAWSFSSQSHADLGLRLGAALPSYRSAKRRWIKASCRGRPSIVRRCWLSVVTRGRQCCTSGLCSGWAASHTYKRNIPERRCSWWRAGRCSSRCRLRAPSR